jgi:hypothetical protein
VFDERFGNKSNDRWSYYKHRRPDPIRLWNDEHELCERTFQLIYCHNWHLRWDDWHFHADDGFVRAQLISAYCSNFIILRFENIQRIGTSPIRHCLTSMLRTVALTPCSEDAG